MAGKAANNSTGLPVIEAFDRTDPNTGRDTHWAVGDLYPADGPDVEQYIARKLIVRPDSDGGAE
jgi:hypothetical protein